MRYDLSLLHQQKPPISESIHRNPGIKTAQLSQLLQLLIQQRNRRKHFAQASKFLFKRGWVTSPYTKWTVTTEFFCNTSTNTSWSKEVERPPAEGLTGSHGRLTSVSWAEACNISALWGCTHWKVEMKVGGPWHKAHVIQQDQKVPVWLPMGQPQGWVCGDVWLWVCICTCSKGSTERRKATRRLEVHEH